MVQLDLKILDLLVNLVEVNYNNLNLFERILSQYEIDSKKNIPEIAKSKLYDKVYDNNLDPAIELEITFVDKLIFIFLIIIIRIIALQITYYFIDRNAIVIIKDAIKYYTISYILIFILCLVQAINYNFQEFAMTSKYYN